jgi:glycosyltransferase involved in cell wall biosynthesis
MDEASGLDIYWYCPFPYPHIPHLARTVMREGDRLLAHLPAGGLDDPLGSRPCGYDVVNELPDVTSSIEHRMGWAVSRARTYRHRANLRKTRARSRHFDLCHIHFLNYFTDGASLGEIGRHASLVSNVHDVLPHHRRMWPALERRLLAAQYRRAGSLIVAHQSLRDQLLAEFDVAAERVTIIPLPIPDVPDIVEPEERDPEATLRVLFFGTLRRNKGIDVLLDAIKRMDTLDDVRFRIAGRGASDVEQAIHAAERRDSRIEAEIGVVSDERKDELFRSATLVVLPYTTFTSQSGVLGDAYAYRLPVVVTDVGALGATVDEDRSGWVVPPKDASALATALEAALSDGRARVRAAVAARRVAADRSYESVGRQIRDLYERIAA